MIFKLTSSQLLTWADDTCTHPSWLIRTFHSLCRVICITIQEYRKNDLNIRAAALTFTVLLSLVPVLAMSTSVIKGLGGGDQLKRVMYNYVATLDSDSPSTFNGNEQTPDNSPTADPSSVTQHLYSVIDQIFDYVDKINFATLGTIGVIGIFISVILVLGNIELAMNAIWNVENGRSILRKLSDYLALLVLMPISMSLGLTSSTILKSDTLLSKFSILLPMAWVQPLLLKLLPLFFLSLTLFVIYLFFPNTKVKTIPATVGALFAGFFWFEVQNMYITLQLGVSNYNAIYGSFATLPLFLIWLYFGWIFILIGAQIAYAYQHKQTYILTNPDEKPSLRLAAAYDLLNTVYDNFTKQQTARIEDFQKLYPNYRKHLITGVVDDLATHNLLHKNEKDLSLLPSLPREYLENSKIVRAILGMNFSETTGGNLSKKVLDSASAQTISELASNHDTL